MKTNEVEKLLGLSKHTILYYEKEGLIHPNRDENGYRHFEEQDIQILKLIMELRNMEMGIDEIHDILDGKTSIRDILYMKEAYLIQKNAELNQKRESIEKHMKREKVNITFDNQTLEQSQFDILSLNKNHIQKEDLILPLKDIKEIKISMCSEIGLMNIGRIFMNYYIDIDIITGFDTYSYQIMNDNHIQTFFQYLHQHHINFEDILQLEDIYRNMPDSYQRNKYLNNHFKKWAKKYHLDNPRGKYMYTKQSELTHNEQIVKNVLNGFHIKKKA